MEKVTAAYSWQLIMQVFTECHVRIHFMW